MATTPSFISTPRIGMASLSGAASGYVSGSTSNLVDVLTAATAGTRILEVVITTDGDPADSVVSLWLNDGSTGTVFDAIDIGNPAAASTTVAPYRTNVTYQNLILPNGWKLQAGVTVAPTTGTMKVWALGGDLT